MEGIKTVILHNSDDVEYVNELAKKFEEKTGRKSWFHSDRFRQNDDSELHFHGKNPLKTLKIKIEQADFVIFVVGRNGLGKYQKEIEVKILEEHHEKVLKHLLIEQEFSDVRKLEEEEKILDDIITDAFPHLKGDERTTSLDLSKLYQIIEGELSQKEYEASSGSKGTTNDSITDFKPFIESFVDLVVEQSKVNETGSISISKIKHVESNTSYDGDLSFYLGNEEVQSCEDIYEILDIEKVISLTGPALCGKGYVLGRYIKLAEQDDIENIHCLVCRNNLLAVDEYISAKVKAKSLTKSFDDSFKLEVCVLIALEILQQFYLKNKSKSRKAGKADYAKLFFRQLFDRDLIREKIEEDFSSLERENYFTSTFYYIDNQIKQLYENGVISQNKSVIQVEIQDGAYNYKNLKKNDLISEKVSRLSKEIFTDIREFNQIARDASVKLILTTPLSREYIDPAANEDNYDFLYLNRLTEESVREIFVKIIEKIEAEKLTHTPHDFDYAVNEIYNETSGYFVHVVQFVKNIAFCVHVLNMDIRAAVKNVKNNPILWYFDVAQLVKQVLPSRNAIRVIKNAKSMGALLNYVRQRNTFYHGEHSRILFENFDFLSALCGNGAFKKDILNKTDRDAAPEGGESQGYITALLAIGYISYSERYFYSNSIMEKYFNIEYFK